MQCSRMMKAMLKLPADAKAKEIFAQGSVQVPATFLKKLLMDALTLKGHFDEQFYLKRNPDIRAAVLRRKVKSGAEHYYKIGYFEGRMPKEILVDEAFYLKKNKDVSEAIKAGKIKSAQEHFDRSGFKEGRIPYEGFSLF